jgi:ankyrin repeat protein
MKKKVLVDAGIRANTPATGKGLPMSESALHWIGAFDENDQRAATSLLVRAGARVASNIAWNHPLIDLPGKFPLGTPLHYAAYFNSPLLVELLLNPLSKECTANVVNMKGSSMLTPLEFAARYHRYDVVQALINYGALDDPAENKQVLHEVSTLENYHSWAASGLCNSCPDEGSRLCALALLKRRPSLLEQGDSCYQTPLLTACFYHNRAVVKYLIGCCCDVNTKTPDKYDGRTALNMCSNNQLTYADDDILDLLHEAGADLELGSASGLKPLHFAARDENVRVAKKLLELGAKLDSRSDYGLTPLHSAAQYAATGVGRLLLDSGANPYAQHGRGTFNDREWSGLTPLAIAASTPQKGFIKLLIEDTYNLDAIARPSNADTVIHFAITNESAEMLQRLLQFPKLRTRELIDRKNLKGVTALHLASGNILRHKHIELLINAGADINLPTSTGHTALDIAYKTQKSVEEGLERGRWSLESQ